MIQQSILLAVSAGMSGISFCLISKRLKIDENETASLDLSYIKLHSHEKAVDTKINQPMET